MRTIGNSLTFTGGERVVLAMAVSWRGLRQMVDRSGFWSKKDFPRLPGAFHKIAERLLLRFGDLKMGETKISKVCAWAMEAIEEDVFFL